MSEVLGWGACVDAVLWVSHLFPVGWLLAAWFVLTLMCLLMALDDRCTICSNIGHHVTPGARGAMCPG